MLRRLLIENYGLIALAQIDFAGGATIFTGETGSGKTMLLGALGLALGERASMDAVRRGAKSASVTLSFAPDAKTRARLSADGYAVRDGDDATIVREVSDGGKSSVRLCGKQSTAGYVREIAGEIADVVGQHDAQRLLAASYHTELLDRFGGEKALRLRARVATAHSTLIDARKRLDALEGNERAAKARYDDARYAVEEIEAARIESGEDERLTQRRRLLDNVERISGALRGAREALAGDERAADSALGAAAVALHGVVDVAPSLEALHLQTMALQGEIGELAARIARELDATEFDPNELETINTRLDAFDRLKRKYGGTLEAVLAHARIARITVDDYEARDERVAELRDIVARAQRELQEVASLLGNERAEAGKALSKRVAAELGDLALANARFSVSLEALDEIGPDGAEHAEFMFAANAGQPLRPLARVASGGELSRVLLALVVALAERRDTSTLVFDEIDAGIGGATATAVGARLGRLARDGQVVCVTHLAQIATWADSHYVLEKSETKTATTISVRKIAAKSDREVELARMLSGETHETALEHARTLLAARR